jgi:hypothetical protein
LIRERRPLFRTFWGRGRSAMKDYRKTIAAPELTGRGGRI